MTPEMLVYNKKHETCEHKFTSDFSHYKSFNCHEKESLVFCPDCRTHWYQDKEWNPNEWDEYVNGN